MSTFNLTRIAQFAGAALLILGLSGCPTTYNMGTARTLGMERMEFTTTLVYNGLDLDALVPSESSSDPNDPTLSNDGGLGTIAIPFVDFGFRYGVAENMDLGLSLKGFGKAGIDLKINLLDTGDIALSIDPELSGTQLGDAGIVQFDLPVLVDFILSEAMTVTVAVKYTGWMPFSGADATLTHFVGGTLGLDIKLGDNFAMHPFAGVTYWMGDVADGVEVVLPHGGLGLRVGI
jgi:hypothetical protein